MSSAELTLYNFVKTELKLSEDKAMKFVKVLEDMQESKTQKVSNEYKSIFKEDFYKMDLKIENVRTEIAQSKSDMIKWYMAGFITIVLMILGLFTTIILK